MKFQDKFYDIIDHNKCPSSEKSDEKHLLRKSNFHHSEPSYDLCAITPISYLLTVYRHLFSNSLAYCFHRFLPEVVPCWVPGGLVGRVPDHPPVPGACEGRDGGHAGAEAGAAAHPPPPLHLHLLQLQRGRRGEPLQQLDCQKPADKSRSSLHPCSNLITCPLIRPCNHSRYQSTDLV